jgi:hypothetical protein
LISAQAILVALARRYSFRDLGALAGSDAQVIQLCTFGQRLLDLDAEDFGTDAVPGPLRDRALACRMPQVAGEPGRGALGSLRPAYSLLLEVIDARWRRREMAALVATLHITSEYAPLLVWEAVLGHAGDPARLPSAVGGRASRWGDLDAPPQACPHGKADRSAARHALRVAHEPPTGWQSYLDRQHSNTAHALATCAAACLHHCSVVTRLSKEDERVVADGCRLALAYADSAVVRLRHSAPVGHGFGVPSADEVTDAWRRTRDALGRLDRAVLTEDGFPLPGLTSLFTAFAGRPIAPDTLLADTADLIVAALDR